MELLLRRSDNNGPKASRCSICAIDYPPFMAVCRVCGGETWHLYKSGPQEDWERVVGERTGQIEPEPESIYPHPPNARCRIGFWSDRLWVAHEDLLSVGYRAIEDGTIIFINGRFFELEGYNGLRKEWWVEEVITEGAADELYPAMFEIVEGVDE